MAGRPRLHSVGGGVGPDPPSSIFQKLCADYPELPRRVVGEVLARVLGTAGESAEGGSLRLDQTETASRALLDAICVRSAEAARRTQRQVTHLTGAGAYPRGVEGVTLPHATDLREALDPSQIPQVQSRVERLAEALEERARAGGVSPGLNLVCEAAAEHLGLAAVAVSVPGRLLSAQTVGVAGALARPLEERQVILGEGPSTDGLRFGTAVHVEDLTDFQQKARWPMYAAQAAEDGIRAQFVIPMQVGAARFGVFVLYLNRPGGLWPSELSDARVFAELALGWLIDDVAGHTPGRVPRTQTPFLDDRAEIHQATGMVAVQLGVDLNTALVRLRAHAFSQDRLLSQIAVAVVNRELRFQPESDNDEREFEESP